MRFGPYLVVTAAVTAGTMGASCGGSGEEQASSGQGGAGNAGGTGAGAAGGAASTCGDGWAEGFRATHNWPNTFPRLAATVDGDIVLGVDVYSDIDLGTGALGLPKDSASLAIARMTCRGETTLVKTFSAPDGVTLNGLVTTEAGIAIGGSFSGELDVGPNPLQSTGVAGFVALLDHDGNAMWSHGLSAPGSGEFGLWAVATGDEGATYIAGSSDGATDLGAGPLGTGHLVKLDLSGDVVWQKDLGTSPISFGTAMTGLAGGGLAICVSSGSFDFGEGPVAPCACAKLDAAGEVVWQKSFGSSNVFPFFTGLAEAPDGRLLATGMLGGEVDFGGGPVSAPAGGANERPMFIVALDSEGNHVFSRAFGLTTPIFAPRITAGSEGEAFIAGAWRGAEIDFGGGPIASAGDDDAFFAAFDEAGMLLTAGSAGDVGVQAATAIAPLSGSAVIAGTYEGEPAIAGLALPLFQPGFTTFVARLDP